MTEMELKALAYEQIVLVEQSQNNLRLINAELQKRADEPKEMV